MMDLELTRSLLAVADQGAITEAARVLAISQSALSRRIQQLEEELGAQLLVRSRRGVVLTEMGRIAVDEGRRLVERYQQLKQRLQAHLRLDEGLVRTGGGATAVSFLIPPAIATLAKLHPQIVFQLKEAGSREIEQDVIDGVLEVGVVTLPIRSAELDVKPLFDDHVVLVAGRDHPLCREPSICPEALDGQNLVGFEAGSAIRQLIDGALRDANIEMHVAMELRSIPTILHMVATTRNLAFVSELGLSTAPAGTQRLPLTGLRITRKLGIIQKRHRPLSPAASAFAQALSQHAIAR